MPSSFWGKTSDAETIPGTKTDDSIELGAPLKFFLVPFSFKKKELRGRS